MREGSRKEPAAFATDAAFGRRAFLKRAVRGALGGAAFALGGPRAEGLAGRGREGAAAGAPVALVKGEDRKTIVRRALELVGDDILAAIRNKRVFIKPNVVVNRNPLAATHVDAVRAVLEFLAPHHKGTILVGESATVDTADGFRRNGYLDLPRDFDCRVVDFNAGADTRPFYVFDRTRSPRRVRIISEFLDPRLCLVSVARMKTHDTVLVTLSLKNVLMGAPLNDYRTNDKGFLHGPDKAVNDILHFNLFHLAHEVWPDVAVIDGFEAMEGDGPASGTPFPAKVALASRDALAADAIATRIMGFDPARILYLAAMAEAGMGEGRPDRIRILGGRLEECLYRFKPHRLMAGIYGL